MKVTGYLSKKVECRKNGGKKRQRVKERVEKKQKRGWTVVQEQDGLVGGKKKKDWCVAKSRKNKPHKINNQAD